MAEYWKSTPSYWCKFCSIYVRDTAIEKKNHEASGKHNGAIQKHLRDIAKGKDRAERDRQYAKEEVARLNALVGGKTTLDGATKPVISGLKDVGRSGAAPQSTMSAAAQRKAHAEQLLVLGVGLPEELKREVTGVGSWHTVSERVIEDDQPRTLANIKDDEDSKEDIKRELLARGVQKRKAADEEAEDEAASRRRAWGSKMKTYPGAACTDDSGDLDALLRGVKRKKPAQAKREDGEEQPAVKGEDSIDEQPINSMPNVDAPVVNVKQKTSESGPPAVVFKKRKMRK